jgi:hypothetical protein
MIRCGSIAEIRAARDKRHALAGERELDAHVAADRPCSDHTDLHADASSPTPRECAPAGVVHRQNMQGQPRLTCEGGRFIRDAATQQ